MSIDLSKRFSSSTGSDRMSLFGDPAEDVESDGEVVTNIEAELESLMVSSGFRLVCRLPTAVLTPRCERTGRPRHEGSSEGGDAESPS